MFKNFKYRDKSLELSLPKAKELHGVKIVKLPIARYLAAVNTLENLPHIFVSELIPNADSAKELLEKLINGDGEFIETLLFKMLTVIPKELCRLLSELLGIPEERLLDVDSKNPLSLNELAEVLIAFWEENDMSDFFVNVRRLSVMLTALTQTTADTGSKNGLQ